MQNILGFDQRNQLLKSLYGCCNPHIKAQLKAYFVEQGFGKGSVFEKKMGTGKMVHKFLVQEVDVLVDALIGHLPNITVRSVFAELFEDNAPENFGYRLPLHPAPVIKAPPRVNAAPVQTNLFEAAPAMADAAT